MVQYHEHDSLLQHVYDEELSEAEQRAAWESYNAEKSAETARYNFQVLHSRLEQSTSAAAAHLPPSHQQPSLQQQPPAAGPRNPYGQDIAATLLNLLTEANAKVGTLARTQHQQIHLTQRLRSGCSPEETQRVSQELQRVNEDLKRLFVVVSTIIKASNEALTVFNQHQAVLPPQLSQQVAQLRQYLLQKIHALPRPRLDSATPGAMQGVGLAPLPPGHYH